ncbi:MAG: efflux RND transporter periplasmic adaptor subunit [Planctomycetes bacterium]|nr:efflux RND transporter periplasmic adaptor subunit [Planctomycetota bacterium]
MDLQSLKIERKPQPVRTGGSRWPLRLVVLAVLGGAAWLFLPQLLGLADRVRLPAVRTHLVRESTPAAAAAVRGTAANGYVVAARRAALSSDVPGRIVEMAVREGSVVKRGDIVARLFADEYRAALARAEADLNAANLAIERAEANARTAEAEVRGATAARESAAAQRLEAEALRRFADAEQVRAEELVRTGVGSTRDIDRASSDRDAAVARCTALAAAEATAATAVATAEARLATAGAEIAVSKAQRQSAAAGRDLAQATLDKTDVRAPFDGIVVLKDAEIGEVVSPNVQGGSNARGAVCTLVDFDSLEVQANVPETTLGSVRQGAPADVFLDAYPDQAYPGVVDRIWPTADRQKATVEVRVKLTRKDDRLRPEMGVRIVFRDEPSGAGEATAAAAEASGKRRIAVPENALVPVDGQLGAFVVERDTVRFVPITAGERKSGRVAIDAGLQQDQRIVLDPPPQLRDGDRVRLQDN